MPIALYKVRNPPTRPTQITPFKAVYGRPPPIFKPMLSPGPEEATDVAQQVVALRKATKKVLQAIQPVKVFEPIENILPFQPDYIWVKSWKSEPLTPR